MSEDESYANLILRVRQGDEQAAGEIFQRFASRLMARAQDRLGHKLRQKEDPEDAVQSAFGSFFVRLKQGQFDFEGWEGVWGLLLRITLRKCGHRLERYTSDRRDVRREVAPKPIADDNSEAWQATGREPDPAEVSALEEIVGQLLDRMPTNEHRSILELRLQGYSLSEISQQTHISERSVSRVLDKVKTHLKRRLEPEE